MKLKKIIFLTLIGGLVLTLIACDNDNNSDTTSFENDFPLHDMSEYEIGGDHRFYYVTMDEALQLLDDESFNGILYFGFPGCPWCQVVMPLLHEVSQETNTDVFYVSRRHDLREGEWVDWDEEMAWWLYERIEMNWIYEEVDEDADEDALPVPIRPNIFVPQIIHLRNGVIVDHHRGTFEGHDIEGEGDDRYLPELTESEHDTLFETYMRIFSGVHEAPVCPADDENCD